uniref:Uncharacterized protein n=1 Tax=Ralstonia syzygii R24 TaxID=907261 RepID=G3A8Q1_9RALS|nr:hypothetical protein RALSY_mp10153 [Ralstonia syzygii R24]
MHPDWPDWLARRLRGRKEATGSRRLPANVAPGGPAILLRAKTAAGDKSFGLAPHSVRRVWCNALTQQSD